MTTGATGLDSRTRRLSERRGGTIGCLAMGGGVHDGTGAGGVFSANRRPGGKLGTGGGDETRARSGTDERETTTRSSGIQSSGRGIAIGEGPGPKVFVLGARLLAIDGAGE
jgi:hypothetical protein